MPVIRRYAILGNYPAFSENTEGADFKGFIFVWRARPSAQRQQFSL
jgi:hypothetical protein